MSEGKLETAMIKKKNILNKNSIPFLLLLVIHMCMLVIFSRHKKSKSIWILLLSNIGFAYLFEYPTLNIFHGYKYKPSIMKNRVFDSILGAIFSQAFYVPVTATLLTLFKKGWKWKVSASMIYYGIELLFLRLRIYQVTWWKSIYTPVLLTIYFFISDGFYKALVNKRKWAMTIAHYMATEVIWISFMYILAVKEYIRIGRGRIHTWVEHFKIVPLYSLILTLIATITSTKTRGLHWFLLPLTHLSMDTVLFKLGMFKIKMKHSLVHMARYILMPVISRIFYKTIFKG